jgi:hypothetical protein
MAGRSETLRTRSPGPSRTPSFAFGALNLLSAALLGIGVFWGLPDRYLPVDGGAVCVMTLLAGSGLGLLLRTRWSVVTATMAAGVTLALGLVLVGALAVSASYLAGIYGPVGRGGAVLFILVMALAIPYLVALPGAELVWLRLGRVDPAEKDGADRRGAG